MGIYSEKAIGYFRAGYNCAQSVFLAFAPTVGFDSDTALKISSSFGGGMGRLREVCGAVSSMFAVAGLLYGYTQPNNDDIKAKHYELIQSLARSFKSVYGTIICRELLGPLGESTSPIPSKRTERYYAERPCELFVKTASEIIEQELLNKGCKDLPVQET